VDSTTEALILASGKAAEVELSDVTVSGGTLKTSAGGQITAFGANTLSGVTLAASSLIEVTNDGSLTLEGGTIGAGAVIETNTADVFVSGAVSNGGTLFARALGDLVEIASGAVVDGGVALIGNGIVDVLAGGSANVAFLSTGSGGLEIADAAGSTSAFTEVVSGFGGVNHANKKQFIDLVSVTSAPNTVSLSYVSASNTSGTLFVSSGGNLVASIEFVGHYSAGNFHIASGISGTVAITDPGVVNGGSVDTSPVPTFDAHSGIDLPNLAFGAQTTLAYAENAAGAGGMLTVTDGRHAASIALLGNYMAGSFVATADGHGGTVITEESQATQHPLLAQPRG
jgi:hypothetical protein